MKSIQNIKDKCSDNYVMLKGNNNLKVSRIGFTYW